MYYARNDLITRPGRGEPAKRMTFDSGASRVNMLIRLVGLVLLLLGAALTYFTYLGATQASIVPEIVPVFYLGAGLLMVIGFFAIIAKYKA